MAAGDIYQLVVAFANANTGKGLSFTLSVKQVGLTLASMTTVGDDVKEWWDTGYGAGTPAFKTYCPAAITLEEVTRRRVEPLEPVIESYTTGLPIAGTAAGDLYSGQVAPLVSFRTANVGKSYRGRAYLPPISEAFVGSNASISAADAENMAESFNLLRAGLAADNMQQVVWSRKLGIGIDVVSELVDRMLRTQRRRQDRAPVYQAP